MNYLKMQADILKASVERKTKNKLFNFYYGVLNGNVWLGDEVHFEIIPKSLCFIDLEKIFDKPPVKVSGFIHTNLMEVHDTQTITLFKDSHKTIQCHVFEMMDTEEAVWCDVKLLKDFDIPNSTFRAKNNKSPLYIYEKRELVGLVLPVRHG